MEYYLYTYTYIYIYIIHVVVYTRDIERTKRTVKWTGGPSSIRLAVFREKRGIFFRFAERNIIIRIIYLYTSTHTHTHIRTYYL